MISKSLFTIIIIIGMILVGFYLMRQSLSVPHASKFPSDSAFRVSDERLSGKAPPAHPAFTIPPQTWESFLPEPYQSVLWRKKTRPNPPTLSRGEMSAKPVPQAAMSCNDLVVCLWRLTQNDLTPEKIYDLQETLQLLIAQGNDAVPAIQEFLEGGKNVSFVGITDDENFLDYGSLRLVLFDVLYQIGGAESVNVLLAELLMTVDPVEIATLAKFLEGLAPMAYRPYIVEESLQTIELALEDRLNARDVGPLFQVLHDYGDANVLPILQKSMGRWGHYATIALASVAEGVGIPTLIDMAEDHDEHSISIFLNKNLFALQVLAQVASYDPDAYDALFREALSNRIPESMWPRIALTLAGDYQFQIERPEGRRSPHVVVGKNKHQLGQTLYLVRGGTATLSIEEREARLMLIDELISANESPQAIIALENVRVLLSHGAP